MEIVVERVDSAKDYLQYWTKAMADVHWFKEQRLFDYDRKDMMEEITKDFDKPQSLHLVAKHKDEEILGVLGVKVSKNIGILGRWDPAVPLKYRSSGAGEALIEVALSWLRQKEASKATCMLKYPYNMPQMCRWHATLYKKCGFKQKSHGIVALLADLQKLSVTLPWVKDVHFVNGDKFSLKDFVGFTLKAYMSTPQDKAIHQCDPYISNRKQNLSILRSIKNGKMGLSPPELWKVAMFKGEPAGFVISFMPETKYRPPHGIIGELGVFPEFRIKGIASSLMIEIHKCFKKYGCRYSYVGTPKNNEAAIRLYQKMEYKAVFELIDFEQTLQS